MLPRPYLIRTLTPPANRLPYLYAQAVIQANGKVSLAAERINKVAQEQDQNHQAITEAEILEVISNDKKAFAKISNALRASTVLRMFDMQRYVHDALVLSLGDIETADLVRLYGSLSHEVLSSTAQTTKIEISQDQDEYNEHLAEVFKLLPPEIRRAVVEATYVNDDND